MKVEDKRNALEQVLESRVMRRCDQLKKMLRFICEAEIEGRAGGLNEYLIGVEALGRPASYSPTEDSIVRTRAYELRNKLARYYAGEAPDAPVRIEIARGAYVPTFLRQLDVPHEKGLAVPAPPNLAAPGPPPVAASGQPLVAGPPASPVPAPAAAEAVPQLMPAAAPVSELPVTAPVHVSSRGGIWARVALLAGSVILGLAAYAFVGSPRHTAAPSQGDWNAEMESFWKPFLAGNTPLMLTFNSRFFLLAPGLDLMVRNWRTNQMNEIAQSPPLTQFQKQMGVDKFVETRNYVDFGALYSVFLLMRTVGLRQNQMLLKSSQDLDWTDVFNDNIVFVGGMASADRRLRRLLEAGDFREDALGITNLRPKAGERAFYPTEHNSPVGANNGDKYALLSRFPGPQRGRYVMLLGSAHSELPWALAEYVTNSLSIHELMQHVRLPSGELPDAFQVILRVTLQSQVPVRIRYVTHHVVTAPEFPYETPAPESK